MTPERRLEDLVGFFKALAEPNRLKIVGVLARRPHTVGEIAAAVGVSISTASHHLAKLADTGLVLARAEGYYNLYALQTEVLTTLARTLLADARPAPRPGAEGLVAFERKVLETFTTPDGRITAFPVQEKKFLVLLRHVLQAFDRGVRYPEKRVNQILKQYNDDTARLRRALVEHKYMAREGGGGKYWRIDQ
jgi:DNA-binding transcriptional ArsR family regulator